VGRGLLIMRIDVITLFPEMFTALNTSIIGRALKGQVFSLQLWNPRDFTHDKHGRVDDTSYGGGPGMVMQVQPLRAAIQAAKMADSAKAKVVYLSPQGKAITQADIESFSLMHRLILLAGRYEGIDQRIIDHDVDEEWSLGDYILSGGELAAMVLIDAIVRLLPNALGDPESLSNESFVSGLLEYPHFTRPPEIDGQKVPDTLLSGDHQAIKRWRLQHALANTWLKRPDLLKKRGLSTEENLLLQQFLEQLRSNKQ
jgi:tRNA (guanine37-N1)-methyltransferase